MKYTKIYLSGGNKKEYDTDFIIGYIAENGVTIEKKFLINSTYEWYQVGNRSFNTLKEAKRYVENL